MHVRTHLDGVIILPSDHLGEIKPFIQGHDEGWEIVILELQTSDMVSIDMSDKGVASGAFAERTLWASPWDVADGGPRQGLEEIHQLGANAISGPFHDHWLCPLAPHNAGRKPGAPTKPRPVASYTLFESVQNSKALRHPLCASTFVSSGPVGCPLN